MSITRNLLQSSVSRRLFSTTVAPNAYYTSSLVSDQVVKKVDPSAKLYDFRSDTVTAPTDEMFDLMKHASRSDDVFQVICKQTNNLIS
jgi:threonine aldolase